MDRELVLDLLLDIRQQMQSFIDMVADHQRKSKELKNSVLITFKSNELLKQEILPECQEAKKDLTEAPEIVRDDTIMEFVIPPSFFEERIPRLEDYIPTTHVLPEFHYGLWLDMHPMNIFLHLSKIRGRIFSSRRELMQQRAHRLRWAWVKIFVRFNCNICNLLFLGILD